MWWIYNLLLTILFPVWVPWMLWRAFQRKERPNWQERFGNYGLPPRGDRRRIWFHAVSVGEVVAGMPILREIRKELPAHEIVLSVTTSSGHQTAREKAEGLFDHLVYFPMDVPRFMLAAMQRVRPDVVAVMETELWMNFLWAAKVFGARTVLVNGRISDRSFPRSMKLRFFYRSLLSQLDRALMQTETDAERVRRLGARAAEVFGNCKFDQALEGLDADPARWREELGLDARPTIVVGSLRAEEFGFFAEAAQGLEGLQWVVAPRHLEKTEALAAALAVPSARRSKGEKMPPSGYLLLDTYGELSNVYSVADAVVVGGGFADLGGQNILQPLAHGKPVVHGPHMQNFRDVAAMAKDRAAWVADSPQALRGAIRKLVDEPALRERMGGSAKELVEDHRGASRRYAKAIADEVVAGAK
ncbi:MAG TPA: 3-deoxy-D-manno-octulosonic acid transferase [Fimbriimonas sp.]